MSRVLIVEDESVLRLTFEQFLSEEGYDVVATKSYNEAVDELERQDPDVVVSDIILGGKTGIDLLRTIDEQDSSCAVIMITGDPSVETAAESVRLGAFDYLPKPVTGPALKKVVRLALEQKRIAADRDRYARQMDEYRRELDAIFNSVNAAIITVDERLQARHWNRAATKMFGVDEESADGRQVDKLFPEAFAPVCKAIQAAAVGEPDSGEIRVEIASDNGTTRAFAATATPLRAKNEQSRGVVVIVRDITQLTDLQRQVEGARRFRKIIGKSNRMQEIFQLIDDMSETDSTVLICGESGTGKELVAEALHETSQRADGPFIRVNCAALSEDILESELFGHVKGAFTGAIKDRAGRFESAHGGTILLDEIGDISPRLQLRLLRVLQEGEFERVGDSRSIRSNVRVIAATNQDLLAKIKAGEFRQDLYYRLNVVRIEIPPLRARREDLPLLVEFFRKKFNSEMKKNIVGVKPEALEAIMAHSWPGNVRELENCMERAFIVCRDSWIGLNHLPPEVRDPSAYELPVMPRSAPAAPPKSGELTREDVLNVLNHTDWNIAKSARRLGVARNTLYQKLRQFDLKRPTF